VEKWADEKNSAITTKRNLLRSVKRCFTWAERQGYVDRNPVANLEVPGGQRREVYVSPEELTILLAFVRDSSFADLLTVAYETGCRPQELLRVETRHVDLARSRWVFPPSEAKVKSGPRVVYLSESACNISRRLMAAHPEGPLFRNSRGRPWTKDSVGCAFDRLQVRMGVERMKVAGEDVTIEAVNKFIPKLKPCRTSGGRIVPKTITDLRVEAKRKLRQRRARKFAPRYSLYALRHSFATNALQRGVDSLTVAILLGHRDASMLARVYQHLSHHPDHLLAEARRACG
jgi:integrase